MSAQKLKHAPLIEAIVEIRWKARLEGDPNYELVLGKLSESFKDKYPVYNPSPNADVPKQLAAQMHMVQHQFRASPNGWPLVQVGPSIFTLNETEAYDWEGDFRQRAVSAVETFFRVYPKSDALNIESILLRYIDAIDFDWEKECLLGFLDRRLKTKIVLPPSLFDNSTVRPLPAALDFMCSFGCTEPQGVVHLRFASGESRGKKCLIMETMVQSTEAAVPQMPQGFAGWLEAAHGIPSTWFRLLTEGDLLRSFKGD
jgi:uncharacterized protein (TIGR04255 family)